jgi:replication factor C subunit 2/4
MIMTEYSSTTRFAIACNDSSKIIEPIQSRCAIVRFTKLNDEEILERLKVVLDKEGIQHSNDGLEALIFTADGDMRFALNNLQATSAGFGLVNKDNVFKVCDQPHPDLMHNVLKACLSGRFTECCSLVDIVFNEGYNLIDIINTLTKIMQSMTDIKSEELRLAYLKEATVIKMKTLEGNNSQLQLHGFLANLC